MGTLIFARRILLIVAFSCVVLIGSAVSLAGIGGVFFGSYIAMFGQGHEPPLYGVIVLCVGVPCVVAGYGAVRFGASGVASILSRSSAPIEGASSHAT